MSQILKQKLAEYYRTATPESVLLDFRELGAELSPIVRTCRCKQCRFRKQAASENLKKRMRRYINRARRTQCEKHLTFMWA